MFITEHLLRIAYRGGHKKLNIFEYSI